MQFYKIQRFYIQGIIKKSMANKTGPRFQYIFQIHEATQVTTGVIT